MTIQLYYPFIIFCSLWCLGIFAITRKGKLFDFVADGYSKLLGAKKAQENLNNNTASFLDHVKIKLFDPVIGCCVCMASLHTLLLYFLFCHFTESNFVLWQWIAIAIPVAFLNELMWSIRTYYKDAFS